MQELKKYLGKVTLIIGDVNAGKTRLTMNLLDSLLEFRKGEIAVIDLAPEVTKGIGGKISVRPDQILSYYTTEIVPPRLTAHNEEDAHAYALKNAEAIEAIFSEYLKDPKETLIINDVSLYLQAGDLITLSSLIDSAHTVIMNGYYGKSLGGGKLGERERKKMEKLKDKCDIIIQL